MKITKQKYLLERLPYLSALLLGFSALTTQIVFIRQFISVLNGNELVIAVIFLFWFLLTGLGAFLVRFVSLNVSKLGLFALFHFLLGIIPFITFIVINYLKPLFFDDGLIIDIYSGVIAIFIISSPFCLLCGALFTFLCKYGSENLHSNITGKIYSIESVGSIIGGIIFSFIVVFYLSDFQFFKLLMLINSVFCGMVLILFLKFKIRYIYLVLIIIISAFGISVDSNYFIEKTYKNQVIIRSKDTPYGNITITKIDEQLNFYENGNQLFITNDVVSKEEAVHYAMSQKDSVHSVLLVGGGVTGIIGELEKYKPAQIDLIEINQELINIAQEFLNLEFPSNVSLILSDAGMYIRKTTKKYDVVILNLPPPSTLAINRFYTVEFFCHLKKNLNPDAVIQISLPPTVNYLNDSEIMINSLLYLSLKQNFESVIIISGNKNYYLASDSDLCLDIPNLIHQRNIENVFVNQYYLDSYEIKSRSDFIKNSLIDLDYYNSDYKPVMYFFQTLHWLSFFETNLLFIIAPVCLIFALAFIILNKRHYGMFITGFSASSIQLILLISFQTLWGSLYWTSGIFFTIFMVGLAFGARLNFSIHCKLVRTYVFCQLLLAVFCCLLFVLLSISLMFSTTSVLLVLILFFFNFGIAFIVGIQFTVAAGFDYRLNKNLSGVYSADLFGSSLGAIITIVLLIPFIGIINSCLVVGILNIVSSLISIINFKKS